MSTLEAALADITDVRTLKGKRTARKGNLKRLSNHLAGLRDTPLERLRTSDLEHKLDSVADNIIAFDLIQDRIDELSSDDSIAIEETDTMDQRRLNTELLDAYQENMDAAKAWMAGDRLQDKVHDLMAMDSLDDQYHKQTYDRVVSDFDTFRQSIKKIPTRTVLCAMKDDLQPVIRDLCTRIHKDLRVAAASGRSPDARSNHGSTPPTHHHHSKLCLELPKFTGDLLQWKDFWNLFNAVIEGEHLSDREKICHLQTAMRSEEAKTVVRHAAVAGSYDVVVAALKKRYDKHRVVHSHHVHALLNRAPVRHNVGDVTKCVQEIELHRSGLADTGGDTLDQFLTAATVLLMDSSCSLHWADYTSHLPDPPNLSTMRDFCEHRLTALQIHPTVKKSDKVDAGSNYHQAKPRDRAAKPSVYHLRETSRDSCPICEEEHSNHLLPGEDVQASG